MFKFLAISCLFFSTFAHAGSEYIRWRLDLRDNFRSFLSTDIISFSSSGKVKMSGEIEQPYTSSCTTINKTKPENKCTESTLSTGYDVVLEQISINIETISFVVNVKTRIFQSMNKFKGSDNLVIDLPVVNEASYNFRFTVKNGENLVIPLKSPITSEKEQNNILNPDLKLVIKSNIIN